jgi:hypothetical protein
LPTVTATGKRTARTGGFVVAGECVDRGVDVGVGRAFGVGVGRGVAAVGVVDTGGVVATVICAWGEAIPRGASRGEPAQPATAISIAASVATPRICVLRVLISGQRLNGTDG